MRKTLIVGTLTASFLCGCQRSSQQLPAESNTGSEPAAASVPSPANAMAKDASGVQVSIDNFNFTPEVVTVAAGSKVTWTNHDDVPHTVKSVAKQSSGKAFSSPALDTDQAYSFVFKAPGEYDYFCSVHPHMTAKIIVK